MADYNGVLLFDPEDANAEWYADYDIVETQIDAEDAADYSPSYTPTEGCTP
jgi:hypothetical protein